MSEPAASTAAPARARAAVGAGAAVRAIAGVTWTRLWRGRAVWIAAGIAALPYLLAAIGKAASRGGPHPAVGQAEVLSLAVLVMAVLPPLLVASAVAEELEDKTAAYLWSRPIARWTVLVGKLVVLLPLAAALVAGGTAAALRTLGPVDGGAGLTTISAAPGHRGHHRLHHPHRPPARRVAGGDRQPVHHPPRRHVDRPGRRERGADDRPGRARPGLGRPRAMAHPHRRVVSHPPRSRHAAPQRRRDRPLLPRLRGA